MNPSELKSSRRVSSRVHAIDRAAQVIISGGGFLVLAAVLGICLYLAYVVVPLFSRGSLGETTAAVASTEMQGDLVLDPYGHAMAVIDDDGVVRGTLAASGGEIGVFGDVEPMSGVSAVSVIRNGAFIAIGTDDGLVRLGSVEFKAKAVAVEKDRAIGEVWVEEDGAVYEMTRPGRARRSELVVAFGSPVQIKDGEGEIEQLDYRVDSTGKTYLLVGRADGTIAVSSVRTIRPLGGGKPRTRLRSTSFRPEDGLADWVFITAEGDSVFLLDRDGRLRRYARGDEGFAFAETVQVVDPGREVTAAAMLLGSKSLMIGDSLGDVGTWSVSQFNTAGEVDVRLVRTHAFSAANAAVVDMSPSMRDRSVAVLGADGAVRVRHATSEKLIVEFDSGLDSANLVRLFPKNDGVLAFGSDGAYSLREMEPGYPEFSVKALFGRVHYEGQSESTFVYQSSAGDDAAETKLSLMPLIFGTLKATVFAMLFAVPVGVLAAIYTSEFLSHRVRRVVKPGVEMMASLPSVVLGFIAAMVVAPYVRDWLPEVLIGLATVPVGVLIAAHLWQLVPLTVRRRMRTGQHLCLVFAACLFGVAIAVSLGPVFEKVLFGNPTDTEQAVDMRRWLNGEYGGAWPGWTTVLVAPAAICAVVINSLFLRRSIDALAESRGVLGGGLVVLIRFFALLVLSGVLAAGGASVLSGMGFDPRDSILGTFSPRNTLVVAMIMGFAVIPIIYTISDDALQAVPNTLRAASLGAGATPWQTAVRVVLPVAASGIFSACMIGFGRAVGETMIVLMATGNTPEMEWNIFGGFRTLAANIAVELPEAPKGETHYRVLFLCGFVLFVMTFLINTTAEVVRQVVRARNAGL